MPSSSCHLIGHCPNRKATGIVMKLRWNHAQWCLTWRVDVVELGAPGSAARDSSRACAPTEQSLTGSRLPSPQPTPLAPPPPLPPPAGATITIASRHRSQPRLSTRSDAECLDIHQYCRWLLDTGCGDETG